MAGTNRQQGRVLVERVVDALLDPGQAARGEAAARGQVDQVRHVAGDDRQLLAEVADDRDRPDEAAGIRMERLAEQRHDVGLLDDLAGVHHCDPIAHLGDHPEVVGDQDDRGAGLVAQIAHEVEDLGLDRHVERGGGLVGDQQLGLARKRHRDHDPLRHPAGHLVRVRLEPAGRVGDADHPQQLDRARLGGLALQAPVDAQDLLDLGAHVPHRVQRRGRLLEDHRDPLTADLAHRVGRELEQVLAVEQHLAAPRSGRAAPPGA